MCGLTLHHRGSEGQLSPPLPFTVTQHHAQRICIGVRRLSRSRVATSRCTVQCILIKNCGTRADLAVPCDDRLLRLMALALDLPADFFADKFADGMGTLTPIHYTPGVSRPGQMFGAGAHTDFGEEATAEHIGCPCLPSVHPLPGLAVVALSMFVWATASCKLPAQSLALTARCATGIMTILKTDHNPGLQVYYQGTLQHNMHKWLPLHPVRLPHQTRSLATCALGWLRGAWSTAPDCERGATLHIPTLSNP